MADGSRRHVALVERVTDVLPVGRLTAVLAVITALALVARLVLLGERVAHWDEARVGYWILEFWRTGTYHYRPILHGPFLHIVNARVFAVLGPTDYAMRVVPAVLGGLVPLSALLFRERLHDAEVVALGLFLAANPVLLYFSRFMRGDVLVGAFMFVAFALLVRGIDAGDRRYLFPAVGAIALGCTVKENAVVYLVAWVGAAVLLVDHRLLLARERGRPWTAMLRRKLATVRDAVRPLLPALAFATVEFLAIVAWFYAPRGGATDSPGLGTALANPGLLPATLQEAIVGSAVAAFGTWIGPRTTQDGGNAYLVYLGDLVRTVGFGASAIAILAVVGFVVDRYGGEDPRDLVQFTFYWGLASLLGYPLITDIAAPWAAVHVVLPLAVPAAVGLAHVYGFARDAGARSPDSSVDGAGSPGSSVTGARSPGSSVAGAGSLAPSVAGVVLALVAVQVLGVAVATSYVAPQSPANDLAQYAQPAGQMRPVLEDMATVAQETEGPHVLVFGSFYVDGGSNARWRPACVRWFRALPLPWYFAANDVNVTCATNTSAFDRRFGDGRPPPIVVANATIENGRALPPPELDRRLTGYEVHLYDMRSHRDLGQAQPTAFYVRGNLSSE